MAGSLFGLFLFFSQKTYIVCIHWNHLIEMIPMGTHNKCFIAKIDKNNICDINLSGSHIKAIWICNLSRAKGPYS